MHHVDSDSEVLQIRYDARRLLLLPHRGHCCPGFRQREICMLVQASQLHGLEYGLRSKLVRLFCSALPASLKLQLLVSHLRYLLLAVVNGLAQGLIAYLKRWDSLSQLDDFLVLHLDDLGLLADDLMLAVRPVRVNGVAVLQIIDGGPLVVDVSESLLLEEDLGRRPCFVAQDQVLLLYELLNVLLGLLVYQALLAFITGV